jgi:hypothetical protein
MHRYRNGIRGPTWPDKANDRAGNAAVRETDRDGSGTNQPSRVSRYLRLAPAASVGGGGEDVKVGARHIAALTNRTGREAARRATASAFPARPIAASTRYTESGTDSDER